MRQFSLNREAKKERGAQTSGQKSSRVRKIACKARKKARLEEEAKRRKVSVHELPAILQAEFQQANRHILANPPDWMINSSYSRSYYW